MSPSRLILSSTAIVAGVCAFGLMFEPLEVLRTLNSSAGGTAAGSLGMRLTASSLLGFAMLNWMTRGRKVGGIHGRPLAVANLVHWGSGAAAWAHMWQVEAQSTLLLVGTLIWLVCTLAFSWLLFFHDPVPADVPVVPPQR